jgi:cytochrome bd ubiquinol oxidase subunit II
MRMLRVQAWSIDQLPNIVPPDLTVTSAASPPSTLWAFLVSATVGMLVLIPSLWFLFHVFNAQDIVPPLYEKEVQEEV